MSTYPSRVAWAVVYGDDDAQVFVAQDDQVLTRLLALRVVAATRPSTLGAGAVGEIRQALLDERWGDAVAAWISASGTRIDAYPDEPLWTAAEVDQDTATLRVQFSPIFEDPPGS